MEKQDWRLKVAEYDCGAAIVERLDEVEKDLTFVVRELGHDLIVGEGSERALRRTAEVMAALDTLGEMIAETLDGTHPTVDRPSKQEAAKMLGEVVRRLGTKSDWETVRHACRLLDVGLPPEPEGERITSVTPRAENDSTPDVSNGMGFLDTLERDLANAIEHAGSCQLTEDEDGAELLGALASAWKNLRYARRELDVTFWDKYRRTGDPPRHDHDFDTSDNQAQVAAQ